MRSIRISACLAAALALSAVVAAPASANPEFEAAKYPLEEKGTFTNPHGFEVPNAVYVCREEFVNTTEQGAANPTRNSPTLLVHPIYGKCRATIGTTSATVKLFTLGCNYLFHAAAPTKLEGTFDIQCAAGKEIRAEVEALPGCVISTPSQTALGKLEYRNEPEAGTEKQKVTFNADLSGIHWKATGACGIGSEGTNGVYREGEIVNVGGVEEAKMSPAGKPATTVTEGLFGTLKQPDPVEVGINEPHWYENHVPISKQSGGPGEEGTDAVSWGKLVLTTATLGTIECETEFGGDAYNPQGGGNPPGGGMATAGEFKVDSFDAYDCTNVECETTLNSKESITPEGLGVAVEGGVAKALEWEGKLVNGSPTRLKVGNKTLNSPTQIKFHILCPKTTGAEQNSKAKGELTPEVENGTSVGSSPSKVAFGAGSGELEIGTTPEGKVTGSLKTMGYEGGEIISTGKP